MQKNIDSKVIYLYPEQAIAKDVPVTYWQQLLLKAKLSQVVKNVFYIEGLKFKNSGLAPAEEKVLNFFSRVVVHEIRGLIELIDKM